MVVHPRSHHKLVRIALAVGVFLSSHTAYSGVVVGDVPLTDNPQVLLGLPQSSSQASITVSRRQYVISWNYERRFPEWVAWSLNKRQLGDVTRTNLFRLDRDLDEALVDQNLESVGPNDYKGSCLDRGHQVPSGDRTASEVDNESTFIMSNIMPQSAFLNRRTWVSLERFLRRQVLERGQRVQIYAAAIPDPKGRGIGPNGDIQVPLANFKIGVLMPATRETPRRDQMRFFVVNFPNVTSKGTSPVLDHRQACWDSEHMSRLGESNTEPYWRDFLSDLDSVERASGVDFEFLRGIHEMSSQEVDALIKEEKDSRPWPVDVPGLPAIIE